MTDVKAPDFKAVARAEAFARRAAAFAAGQGQAAEILADFLAPHRGKALSGYMPMRSEIDPLPAMAAHQGPVGVPVILEKAAPLRFREWSPGCRLVEGAFRAMIPEEGAWIEPQVMIVPMLAYDARGYRLGYGGGFYDRTLELLRARGPVLAVGFAFGAQEMAEVPVDGFDQRLDAVVTEKGVTLFG
ncbi:5-formyltetrahydrofolate cyclo-ligase [Tabrizicola soli]|uniref:5-formyltetrahydrofolate cyclo-ligase n=1 Tax=Tabrizicola soli TaxID=2185115 RepID=A0ABV7DV44_9RHOB|nr:5-formyltetrahydrofolate cyclo-ligase [Tabrizicola soli]